MESLIKNILPHFKFEIQELIKDSVKQALKELQDSKPKELRYYTLVETAKKLNVSRQTLLSYIKKGEVPAKKFKGRYRFSSIEIENLLDEYKSLKYRRS